MKEVELNFQIVLIENRYFVKYDKGGYREATIMEVLLWNVLWEMKTGVQINA